MPHADYLQDVLVFLAAAVIMVPLFQKAKLGAVLGFLVAGVAVGPFGLGLIDNVEGTRTLAELGVVFLLFTIGLELNFKRLSAIGAKMYALGLAQVLVTGSIVGCIVLAFGFSGSAAVTIGCGVALSSTAIAIQVLKDRGQMKTEVGRVGLAILLVQDLAVGPLLVIAQVLAIRGSGRELGIALGLAGVKAIAAIALILLLGRFPLRPLLRLVAEARSAELFAAVALLVALGTSYATQRAGLSMAFGAFLAGLILSETEYRYQVEADIEPFRGVLLGLFFITVGMGMDIQLAIREAWLVLGAVFALLLVKGTIVAVLARLFGLTLWRSLRLAILLAQGGEFAFVLIGIAIAVDVAPMRLGQVVMLSAAISMAMTPLIENYGGRLLQYLENKDAVSISEAPVGERPGGHVVIVGFGEVGRVVARTIRAHGVSYVVLDQIPSRVMEGRTFGEPVYYGGASSLSVLKAVGAGEAAAMIVATERPGEILEIVEVVVKNFPGLPVLSRGGGEDTAKALRAAGIADVVSETMEIGLRLAGAAMDRVRAKEAGMARDLAGLKSSPRDKPFAADG